MVSNVIVLRRFFIVDGYLSMESYSRRIRLFSWMSPKYIILYSSSLDHCVSSKFARQKNYIIDKKREPKSTDRCDKLITQNNWSPVFFTPFPYRAPAEISNRKNYHVTRWTVNELVIMLSPRKYIGTCKFLTLDFYVTLNLRLCATKPGTKQMSASRTENPWGKIQKTLSTRVQCTSLTSFVHPQSIINMFFRTPYWRSFIHLRRKSVFGS